MNLYRVECTGNVREVYLVEAESATDAMSRAVTDGQCIVQESSSVEAVGVRLEES